MNRKFYLWHFRPRSVSASALRFTYTWGLGGAAAILILLLVITGMMLKFIYIPTPDKAYASIVSLQQTIPFGRFIRNAHHWSANLLIITVFSHMLRVFFTGAYKEKQKINWLIGLGLMGFVLASNFTGYLLPWDQLAFWAVTICASILGYLPGIGNWLREVIIGGQELGPETLANFFALHTAVLPAAILLLLPFHFWRIRKAGGLAVAGSENTRPAIASYKPEAIPHLIVRETTMAVVVIALVLLMAALWDAPLGMKANPGLSPNPTKAPWYFAGLQELLLHLHPLVAVTLLPLLTIIALVSLPFLPFSIHGPGIWFGSPRGRRITASVVPIGLVAAALWIIGYAHGISILTWLAPAVVLFAVVTVYLITRFYFNAPPHEAVQGAFAFLLTIFIVFTISGIWFRGASMALIWPWR